MSSTFVVWLTDELELRGWSHTRLAEVSGLSRPLVSNVLRGGVPASCEFVLAVASALQVEPVSLLRLAGHVAEDNAPPAGQPLGGMIAAIRELPPDKLEVVRVFVEFVSKK